MNHTLGGASCPAAVRDEERVRERHLHVLKVFTNKLKSLKQSTIRVQVRDHHSSFKETHNKPAATF